MSTPIRELPRPIGLAAGLSEPPAETASGAALDLRPLRAALWSERVQLGVYALGSGALALLLAFVLPPTFVASVSVLEAPRSNGASALEQLGMSADLLGLRSGGGSNALTYPDVLRSRRLLGTLLEQPFRNQQGTLKPLIEWVQSGPSSPQRTSLAIDELRQRLDIALDRRTNLLRVSVSDGDPVLAAAIANAACAELQRVVMTAMMTQAGANRRFIEQQLVGAHRDLSRAENALRGFSEGNLRFGNAPRLALEQARLIREVRTQEEIVIALTRQREMAKVDENRDVPVLNVLDPAVPPAFRSSPNRALMVAIGVLLGLAVGVALRWPRFASALAARRNPFESEESDTTQAAA